MNKPQIHHLKCWPTFFDALRDGRKPFEVRRNDRGYQTGDVLVLHKWDPHGYPSAHQGGGAYVGPDGVCVSGSESLADTIAVEVTYVLSGMGIEPGYVCLGIRGERAGSGENLQKPVDDQTIEALFSPRSPCPECGGRYFCESSCPRSPTQEPAQ